MLTVSPAARGYDQQIRGTTSLEGYTVYGRKGATVSRRRVVSNIDLGAWNLLPGESDAYYDGPRLSIDFSLRLTGDTGVGKSESSPTSKQHYTPGVEPLTMSLMSAYLDAVGFWKDTLDLRIGRQLRVDTLGFFAFDGAAARMRMPGGVAVTVYLGMDVRGAQLFGYDNYELDGTSRGDRSALEADRYPDLTEPEPRLSAGCELTLSPRHWIDAAASYRAVGLLGNAGETADQRVGGRLRLSSGVFQWTGRVVYNAMINNISEADGEIGVTPLDSLGLFIEYHRFLPTFEGDSIFNVFDMAPQNDLGGRADLRITSKVALSAWGFARLSAESGGLSGRAVDRLVSGAGGGVGANYRTRQRALSGRFSISHYWGEQRIGAELGGGHGFLRNYRLWLSFRLSFWHIEDDFSELYSGDTAGYVISGRFNLTHSLYFLGEFEHYVGDGRESRFTGYALLHMDLWR